MGYHATMARTAVVLGCLDGRESLTFSMANRIGETFNCNSSWLYTGEFSPFHVRSLGSRNYQSFFLPDTNEVADSSDARFHFIRVSGGSCDGTLIVVRSIRNCYSVAYESTGSMLKNGMRSGGRGNLKRFILFLKTKCENLPML
ncbi:hypothetical protein [Xenorhabdus cabanillasii]|uniref:Uncharacterized protein n=1 Tax=Xenorhabdus cabanillasii JM26 TaxID=1427517 RepID=W1IPC2_9GAMM|nr:hypothetical protein [Xenorhabdus cabanillasii]PHM77466.1 hypothetical protein Xcab_02038 [Xenorhabdus cabanillasii JM26]CDL79683.1 hypothetical protein XCR1_1200038 [Xenorhabdus cabanillasii JM26]